MARCSNCGCNRLNYGTNSWICENCGIVVVVGKEKKMDKNSWTYKFGYALGCVVALCAVVAIVALTCRFIMWLF